MDRIAPTLPLFLALACSETDDAPAPPAPGAGAPAAPADPPAPPAPAKAALPDAAELCPELLPGDVTDYGIAPPGPVSARHETVVPKMKSLRVPFDREVESMTYCTWETDPKAFPVVGLVVECGYDFGADFCAKRIAEDKAARAIIKSDKPMYDDVKIAGAACSILGESSPNNVVYLPNGCFFTVVLGHTPGAAHKEALVAVSEKVVAGLSAY